MAASGLSRFCRRFSTRIAASALRETHRIPNHKHILSRNFFLKCADQASQPVLMPALSPTMTEGTIVKWLKNEGDPVAPGDVLCEIQTDKAVVSMEIDEEGILAKILKPENTSAIKIGTMIAVMVEEGDDWQSVEIPDTPTTGQAPPPQTDAPSQPKAESAAPPTPQQAATETSHSPIGPSVRKLLEEYSISPSQVHSSGPHGRLLKGDVLKYIASNKVTKKDMKAPPPSPTTQAEHVQPVTSPVQQSVVIPGEEEEITEIPLTNMRRTIARRLTESKTTIPHSYISIDSNMAAVSKLRKELIAEGIKVSMNDFIIKASAIALQRVPAVNSLYQNDEVTLLSNVDISVAVATDQGLITPIVQSAAHLGVDQISSTVKDLAIRAREGKLQLHEFQGGSFTISNLGMFGISEFSAVINPPQTAIMAIGSSRLVLGEDGKPQTNMTVTLSYDSRAIDETQASQFLEVFQEVMENPRIMVVGSSVSRSKKSVDAM